MKESIESARRRLSSAVSSLSEQVEILLEDPNCKKQKEKLFNSKKTLQYLSGALDDILRADMLDAGLLKSKEEPFSLPKIMDSVFSEVFVQNAPEKLNLKTFCSPNLPKELFGDVNILKRILLNVIDNVVRHLTMHSIEVSADFLFFTRTGKARILFVIKGNLDSVLRERQKLIIDYFTKSSSGPCVSGGKTPLGLRLASRMIAGMGGKIWNEDTEHGSIFFFSMDFDFCK
jgi:signal transduction histidine kinase